MKFGVVIFPGSNCDRDVIYALQTILKQEVVTLWHKDHDLKKCDFIILPGGFSYGEYLRSGTIAHKSPIMVEVIKHAAKGKHLLGICNGFQMLCEAGLLPGSLIKNKSHRFICKNSFIKPINTNTVITSKLDPDKSLKIPVAHAEGRYYLTNDLINDIIENDMILFKYCDSDGNITEEANPNGSLLNIAGVCNKNRNVFGIMPHPERATDPDLGNTDGRLIFESIINSLV